MARTSSRRRLTQREAGLRHGWRSGLEEETGAQLDEAGVSYTYESVTLAFTPPAKERTYTPDFVLTKLDGTELIIETKGRWTREDRWKMKWVVEQNPDIDLRIVFQNANARIAKGSKTTYAMWCEKHLGIPWAHKQVPEEWLHECRG